MTFAGSPDRVESRLVPEAGFELDTFEISGFPRKPSVALLRALWRAGQGAVRLPGDPEAATARRRPRRRRLRRRADGARRAAARDPGGAHRGRRPPRPREPAGGAVRLEALPRLRDPGPVGDEGGGRGTPDPGRPPRREPCRGAGPLRLRRRRARRRRLRRARRGDVAQRDGRRRLGRRRRRPCCTSPASATSPRCEPRVQRAGLRPDAADRPLRRRARGGRRRRQPGRRHRLGARRSGDARRSSCPYPHATADHQTLNARHFERGGGAVVVPDAEIGAVPGARRRAARRSRAARGRCGPRCSRWRASTRPTGSPRG